MLELNNADTAFTAICLQESWLTDDSDLSQYQLPNYNIIHQGKKCSGHGGLLIYLHKRYSHAVRKLYDSCDFWEGLFIDISNLSKHVTLGNIHRPPKLNNNDLSISNFIGEFAPILSKLGNEKSETIITGDFNIDLLKVNDRLKVGDYFDLFCTNGFYPKITLPTRFSRDSCTLIDQLFCKLSTETITSTAGILISSISDHLPYCITINNMQSKIRMTPNLVQIRVNNESSIKQYCESVGQSRTIEQLDVNITAHPNSNYNILDDILHELHEKHFPSKKVRFNKYKHKKSTWITMGIINSIKQKDKLYQILKQTCQNDEYYNVAALNIRVYKNILKGAIRKAKHIHYAHLFDLYKTNMGKTWETIKQLLNKNYKHFEFSSTFKINGVNISDKKEIAQQFNICCVNIRSKLAETISSKHQAKPFDSYLKDRCVSSFNFVPVIRDEVISVIHKLAPKKSSGHDLISTNLLKEIPPLIAEPLSF